MTVIGDKILLFDKTRGQFADPVDNVVDGPGFKSQLGLDDSTCFLRQVCWRVERK